MTRLTLDDTKTKELIQAICYNYTQRTSHDTYAADFIEGKGEGQILYVECLWNPYDPRVAN